MKTSKFTSAIATLSLVLFLSVSSYANTSASNSGDLPKSGDKSLATYSTSEKDFNYLRFDVKKFINENEESDLIYNSLDYLRFDVTNFINETEVTELPVANELEYLRFDVNNFIDNNPDNITELPVNEFDYIRFDVNNYLTNGSDLTCELPVKE
jgi:hypothetical protein